MDLHKMKIFLTVFKEKSITKAAEKLFISQPTVTEHLKLLEEELGQNLFIRAGKRLNPTEYALMIYPKISRFYNEYIELMSSLNLKKRSIEKLTIGCSSVPSEILIPTLLKRYLEQSPDTNFEIITADSAEIIQKVLSYEIPLGFVGTKINNESLIFEKVYEDELVIAAKHGVFDSATIKFEDIKKHPMVFREEGSGTRKELERFFKEQNLSIKTIKPKIITNDQKLLLNLLKQNNCIGFISKSVAKNSNLSVHYLQNMSIKRDIFAVYRKNLNLTEGFINLLKICRNLKLE